MTTDVHTVTPDKPVGELATLLLEKNYSGMPVVTADQSLIGMVSEYDIISRKGQTVGEIMSRGVISVDADAGADEVAGIMGLHGIRRVPVVHDGQLVGIVSRTDLLRLFTSIHWTCQTCGRELSGFTAPATCPSCSGSSFTFSRTGN
jgi:CBS domain-containing protein